MLDAVVMDILDAVFLLAGLWLVKDILQKGLLKGFWQYVLDIEAGLIWFWNAYSRVFKMIFGPIISVLVDLIFWPLRKLWQLVEAKQISLVIHFQIPK